MHIERLLKTAHDSGSEVIIQLKAFCCDPYRGSVMDLSSESFTLFHSGAGGGVLWSFLKEDVAFCGLVLERPDAVRPSALSNAILDPLEVDFPPLEKGEKGE